MCKIKKCQMSRDFVIGKVVRSLVLPQLPETQFRFVVCYIRTIRGHYAQALGPRRSRFERLS